MLPHVITFKEQSIFQFDATSIFNVIIDIEKYPDFLPWCEKVNIILRNDSSIVADSVMKFRSITAEYQSQILFYAPSKGENGYIKVTSNEGIFKYLNNTWEFIRKEKNKTLIKFSIECQFRSKLIHYTMSWNYKRAQEKVISAFKDRIYLILKR